MKSLLYLVMSLIVIAAIIPAASAHASNYTTWYFDVTYPITAGPYSTADADAACQAALGYNHYGTAWKLDEYNSAWGLITSSSTSYGAGTKTSGSASRKYAIVSIPCHNNEFSADGAQWSTAPVDVLNFTVSPNPPKIDSAATFTIVNKSYSDQVWDFGDGTTVTIANQSTTLKHTYTSDGLFTVSLVNGWKTAYPRTKTRDYFIAFPDFLGVPVTGAAPLPVAFTAYNLSNTTGLSWSFGDGNVTASTSTINHTYQDQGIYTVRLNYYNLLGVLKSKQRDDYITVGAPNATKTKYFQTIDGTNGNIVLNSSIQLNDVENSSWVNATGLIADGTSHITTLEGHTINAYAQALGYSDADDLAIPNDGQPQYIMMWPTFAQNVSAGNVSLYVTVKDKDTRANIVGAGVTVSLSNGGAQSTTTNEAGIAYFIVTNNTLALITAQAIGQGYQTATTTINTGTASGGSAAAAATILLGKNTVTVVPTATTLPGGGTPTPAVTILPGCEDTISAEGQAKCRAAQSNQGLSFLSANMMDLIMICVFVTMLYLLGIKLGR